MKVHFIAIGGSAMHNLAIALHNKGYQVTGSDDEIFNPSKARLEAKNLMPNKIGWDEGRITQDIEAVILGMHARADNPELAKAQELGLKIYSYPEYIYEQTKDKKRIVVGGSHGKTSITSMILHVLEKCAIETDYMVGAQLEGFDCMVKLTEATKIAVIEGDEYLSSPIDRRPKFHLYHPDVAIISGIAWDHINVFPVYSNYVEQFDIFAKKISENGTLIFCKADKEVVGVADRLASKVNKIGYTTHKHYIKNGISYLETDNGDVPLEIFGNHNLQNLNAARLACMEVGVTNEQFYKAISSFKGASKRLELVHRSTESVMYKDFAHSPSKLLATTNALRTQYPNRELIACMELHTFSSLNKEFLEQYKGSMINATKAFVFFDPKVLEHKKLESLTKEQVCEAFGSENVTVFTDSKQIIKEIKSINWPGKNLLMMSSGNFNGVDFNKLALELFN